ncbi:MAG: bifunctional indole-3-glycerol phosphate synthase/phosphoribosylanthranilate isomerase [Treponema sp.]|nr:bifunctional indole-3-glycerol phosphate synthase/phosphoribosylanthranilate isomerase [Treponema sp.]
MNDILTQIIEKRKKDIERFGLDFGITLPEKRQRQVHPFLPAIEQGSQNSSQNDGLKTKTSKARGVILEVKRASPSKGDIAPNLNAAQTALSYAKAGAAAISCLTEQNYFKGSLKNLMEVCHAIDEFEKFHGTSNNIQTVTAPAVLRKDFLLFPQEVEISYRAGADAILLIARILETDTIVQMAQLAAKYGMTSLVEIRSDEDLQKLSAVAANVDKKYIVCGVNSRDLATFKIDLLKPCAMLTKIRSVLGEDARVVFESGIRTPQAAAFAGSLGFSGMLLGEAAAKNPELRTDLVKSFMQAKPTKNADFWNDFAELQSRQIHRPLVKICGLTNADDVLLADKLGADFAGFIFAAGFARNVYGERFEKIQPILKNIKAKKVAVITDPDSPEANAAANYVEKGILDCIQLHGIPYDKVPQKLLALPHYFALTEKNGDLEKAAEELFLMGEPRFLQDSKSQNYNTNHKLWLAGGITPENASELIHKFQPELIDVSSGVESELCKKDEKKLEKLFAQLE